MTENLLLGNSDYLASAPQHVLFTEYELNPYNDAYDLSFLFRLTGGLDVDRLASALTATVAASPGLRANFHREGAEVIVTHVPPLEEIGAMAIPGTDEPEVWVRNQVELIRAGGRLGPTSPTPVQMLIFTGDQESFLFLRASHLVADAYSFYHVVGVLSALYSAPETEWPHILATCAGHPGNTATREPSPEDLAQYAALFDGLTSTMHPELEPKRVDGRILGTNSLLQVDGELAQQIRDSWARDSVGSAIVFFAAYAAVLHRAVDADTVVVGVPLGNRTTPEARHALGYFVNTLPLPVHIDANTTWRELCLMVRAGVKLLQRCQGMNVMSPEMRAFFPEGTAATTNAVTYYKHGLVLSLPGVVVEPLMLARPSLTYPLTVNVADLGQDYTVEICVQRDQAELDIAGMLQEALTKIANNPDARVINSLVEDVEPGPTSFDSAESLVDLLATAVMRNGAAVAVTDAEGSLTYDELWTQAGRIATHLEAVDATDYVIVRAHRAVATVAVIIGILRSGRAYVPLDPMSPPERERLIVERLSSASGSLPTVINPIESLGAVTSTELPHPVADDVAYVIFTSGSTGRPKGVQVQHGNVVALLRATLEKYATTPRDRWSLFHSFAFDFSVWEMFGCLVSGGVLVVSTPDVVTNPEATLAWLQRKRITVLSQTPSGFRRYASSFIHGVRLPLVRLLVFGGEALHSDDLLPWWRYHEHRSRVVNMYGITETTVHVTERDMELADILTGESLIGIPMEHVGVTLLDRHGRACPSGVVGEIVVTGKGVSLGYLGLPDETRRRFVTLRTEAGAVRAYRSGDLARRRANGELVYHGRVDRQVQLRGYRIELGEIEAAIGCVAGVSAAVVTLEEPQSAEPFVAAWVVGDVSEDSLRAELAKRIPSYMLPGRVVVLDTMPMNQNGKPDMASLRGLVPPISRTTLEADPEPVDLAQRIAQIWESVIGAGAVDVESRFMEVGGSSMHVMPILEQLSQLPGGSGLDVADFFEFPTPKALAEHLAAADHAKVGVR